MVDDVVNKVATIERCLARVREEYGGDERDLRDDLTRQDSIILNLQRACEASIELSMALVKTHRLGPPQERRHAVELLQDAGLLDPEQTARLARMIGFRNVVVRDGQRLNPDIVRRSSSSGSATSRRSRAPRWSRPGGRAERTA